jgi:hypothetical protein
LSTTMRSGVGGVWVPLIQFDMCGMSDIVVVFLGCTKLLSFCGLATAHF